MKKIIKILINITLCTHIAHADKINILNLTPQQINVTLDLANSKSYSKQANPHENSYVQQNLDNQLNQYDNPLTTLTYDHSQIKKVTVNYPQSGQLQIIYYNDEITSENNKANGIYSTFLTSGGEMQIVQDGVKINNLLYNSNDLNSLKVRCQSLKNQLLKNGLNDPVENDINDVVQSFKLIELSDNSSNKLQVAVIKSELDNLVNKLKILQETKNYNAQLQDLDKNLTLDNANKAQEIVNNMLTGLQALTQSDSQDIINLDAIKQKLSTIQAKITSLQNNASAKGHTVLINADSPTI